MCTTLGEKVGAAILAALGFTVFFSAVSDQFQDSSLMGSEIVVVFLKYLVGVLLIGAAKFIIMRCWCKPPAGRNRKR